MSALARRLGTQVTRQGQLFFVGELRPEDRGVLVAHLGVLNEAEREKVGQAFLSEHGNVVAVSTGHLIASDRVEVLAKIAEAVEEVRASPRDAWLIQLHVVAADQFESVDAGTKPDVTLGAAATLDGVDVAASVVAELEAVRRRSSSAIVWEPTLLAWPGQPSVISDRERFPIVTQTNVDTTGVSRENVTFEEFGRRASVVVRPLVGGRGILEVDITDESVVDVIDGRPRSAGFTFSASAEVYNEAVMLLGSVQRRQDQQSLTDWFGWLRADQSSRQVLQVWARVLRVSPAFASGPERAVVGETPDPGSS
ncbi:MAG: hypothetical protein AAGD07_00575 [Planctomycetota bacterium]